MDGDFQDVSYLTHIRDVALLPGERVTHVFSPSAGLSDEPPMEGHLLITTDQRILAFAQGPRTAKPRPTSYRSRNWPGYWCAQAPEGSAPWSKDWCWWWAGC